MQKITHTTSVKSMTNKFNIPFFSLALAIGGLVFSSATIAKPEVSFHSNNLYISYTNAVKDVAPEMRLKDDDAEIGSTYVMTVSAHIGGYNRADGSMDGAYGDGEFDE